MKVRGDNGLVVDVPEAVATAMVAAGHVTKVADGEGENPVKRRPRTRKVSDSTSF